MSRSSNQVLELDDLVTAARQARISAWLPWAVFGVVARAGKCAPLDSASVAALLGVPEHKVERLILAHNLVQEDRHRSDIRRRARDMLCESAITLPREGSRSSGAKILPFPTQRTPAA